MSIILNSTSDLLKVVTASGSTAIDVHVSWQDYTTTSFSPSRTNTAQITTATTTTILASPAASTQRAVKFISLRNASATVANLVTVEHTDGTTVVTFHAITLYPGDALHYNDTGGGFQYIPALSTLPIPGRLITTALKTSGTTYTTGPFTNKIRIRMVGGGGGGAGCTSVAAAASAGGGGGAGSYLEAFVAVAPNTAYTYAIGGAGSGASGASGGNGSGSTFTVGATTYSTAGGNGAPVATALTTVSAYAGGSGSTGSNGDINGGGMPGEPGITALVATPIVASGSGGSGPWGGGGLGLVAVGGGNAASGFGAGGGGAATGASTIRTGGSGTAGALIVEEYV